ncbi:putative PHD type zinc finger protein with BAH domain-containing protein [Elasticomyces elasticus]|nr:putative PHD type zinc finger protein with BAH domain-containing protein [Elasticomyces elasticus]KAK4971737.1 putative PHD type zinc finger protein with BAH domain-containing protein [Elasticomyces elasticus]
MASTEHPENEGGSSTDDVSGAPRPGLNVPPTAADRVPSPYASFAMSTPSFQAVNARAAPQFTALSGGGARPTPPAGAPSAGAHNSGSPAVTPSGPRPAQTANVQALPPHMQTLDGTMDDAATYGTRSRNRNTADSRVNYAEDQEMDFEYTSALTTSKRKTQKAYENAAQLPALGEIRRADDTSRTSFGSPNSTPVPASAAAPTASKKRKAAAATLQHAQTPPVSAPTGSVATRKPATYPSAGSTRETNVMTFTKHKSCLNKKGELVADDGTRLAINDHVYLVCEPPGEPYYLCRIMEFLHTNSDNPASPVDALRVNWYYRPRDVQRFNSDTRLLYGTMHSDICPIASLRGKCMIKHRSEIEDLELYRKERDSFYFVQIFDRFIRRWYECIPVSQIINVPEKVKKALDERWKFVVVEVGRVKELTSAVKTCKRCAKYCASHDSVDCAICKTSYHMNCVQPPLPKKPSRGFAWACGPCSRASERKHEAHGTPNASGDITEAEEEVVGDEEQPEISNDSTRAPSPAADEIMAPQHPATEAEVALAKMWPMRYLGIHCRVEDALQYDDRAIYPRASSRLGPRHQANTNMWHGRPVELIKPAEIKKKYNKGSSSHKKDGKLTKETVAAIEAERDEKARRPKWVQDEPQGYVARGEDYPNDDPRCTAKLLFKMPERGPLAQEIAFVTDYVVKAKPMCRTIGVPSFGVNFLDKVMELLTAYNYNVTAALDKLKTMDRKRDLHEPILTKQELAKFEEGVAKYGSEHRLVRLHMKTTLPHSDIVRFYYLWKKTPKGREVWGNYGGRKKTKGRIENDSGAKLQAEMANEGDDSAFDNDKAMRRHHGFQCKFCHTTHARQWRKAPLVAPGQIAITEGKTGKEKSVKLLLALCLRCAGLWRKYAIQWEDMDEAKKVGQGGGRAPKRRIDEELLREIALANDAANFPPPEQLGFLPSVEFGDEPPKKKSKFDAVTYPLEPPKKKEKPPPPPKEPTPPPPPIIPNQPTWKVLPCAVCKGMVDTIACAHCKLTVHRRCFGVKEGEGVRTDGTLNWVCEQCQNDRHPEVSTDYACCLCLTEETQVDLVEPPKVSHKKKTDREREKERMEKELSDNMRMEYRNRQLALNHPLMPREPLKKTTGNNWVHVQCAVWAPEIRFSNVQKLEVAEGFQLIPPARYEAVCKLCKNKDHNNKLQEDAGACVSCHQCHANFHASCAFEAGYQFGFDVTPVKGSRKDQVTTATLGTETGSITAAVWCKEHVVKSIVHPMDEVVHESGRTALQTFAENYKQADLTLTGTVRKANMVQLTKDKALQALNTAAGRRESTANSIAAAVRRGARTSIAAAEAKSEAEDITAQMSDVPAVDAERRCVKCKIDVTPRWHTIVRTPPPTPPKSPIQRRLSMTLGEYADLQREKSAVVNGDSDAPPPREQSVLQQILPIMPLAPEDRASNGTPIPTPLTNGDASTNEQAQQSMIAVPSREVPPAQVNGDSQPSQEPADTNDVFHSHALPQFQNPAMTHTPPPEKSENGSKTSHGALEFMCHKCFIKKKVDPTPSPPPKPVVPAVLSPPRQFPLQLDWSRPPTSRDGPIRMPWDDPPRMSQPPPPPPPQTNGIAPSPAPAPANYPPPPPSQGSGYPPYGQQPNGYHQPAPPPRQHHGAPHGAPPVHQRQPSWGYGPPPQQQGYVQPPPHQQQPPQQPYTHQAPPRHQSFGQQPPQQYGQPPPRPSPIVNYPPASMSMPNGAHSPHVGQAPLQSPTHMYEPPAPYGAYGPPQPPRRTESPFSAQLPPIGQPLHSSPQGTFARPEMMNGQHGPPQPHPPPQAQPPHMYNGQHSQGPPAQTQIRPFSHQEQQQAPAPQGGAAHSTGQQAQHAQHAVQTEHGGQEAQHAGPATPRDAQGNGDGIIGASASPHLSNLLQ